MVLMLAPLTPHVAEELWERLGHTASLAYEDFPEADPALLVDDEVEVPVQVNGKVRGPGARGRGGADDIAHEAAARADEQDRGAARRRRPCARSSSCPAGWSTSSSS